MTTTVFVVFFNSGYEFYRDEEDVVPLQRENVNFLHICNLQNSANALAQEYFEQHSATFDAIRCKKTSAGCVVLQGQSESYDGMKTLSVWVEERDTSDDDPDATDSITDRYATEMVTTQDLWVLNKKQDGIWQGHAAPHTPADLAC